MIGCISSLVEKLGDDGYMVRWMAFIRKPHGFPAIILPGPLGQGQRRDTTQGPRLCMALTFVAGENVVHMRRALGVVGGKRARLVVQGSYCSMVKGIGRGQLECVLRVNNWCIQLNVIRSITHGLRCMFAYRIHLHGMRVCTPRASPAALTRNAHPPN